MGSTLSAIALLTALATLFAWARARRRRLRWMAQLDAAVATGFDDPGRTAPAPSALATWLTQAGYPGEGAPARFLAATAVGVVAGVIAGWAGTRAIRGLVVTVAEAPGGLGDTLAPVLVTVPYALAILLALAPTLMVRSARRMRVAAIERDLPLVLELLATLAEAGLSLDAALARVLEGQGGERPLIAELRAFQRDLSAGVARVNALRQLAARTDASALSVLVAAVIQAEQVGASLAETLRHQADDLRNRRRERALLQAQAMPVKLVLPLVVCFLPGIFLSTLGPVLYQMIRVADTVLRTGGR